VFLAKLVSRIVYKLTVRLQELSDELDELKEERSFVLGQTGIHLGGNVVKNYEAEVIALTQSIKDVKAKLGYKSN